VLTRLAASSATPLLRVATARGHSRLRRRWSDGSTVRRLDAFEALQPLVALVPCSAAPPPARWETAPRPPHLPAPEIILERFRSQALELELPASRRLPHDSVSLVRSFYDFDFGAFAAPGERAILAAQGARDPLDRALGLLREGSVVAVTVPTPDAGPPPGARRGRGRRGGTGGRPRTRAQTRGFTRMGRCAHLIRATSA
jgi:hypothetical protein